MSRHKIVGHTPRKWGVQIELPSGPARVAVQRPFLGVALSAVPIAQDSVQRHAVSQHGRASGGGGARDARQASGSDARRVESRARTSATTIFVTGDFNEPSPLDWTEAARDAGQCPLAVDWPTTAAVHAAGFVDAYRDGAPRSRGDTRQHLDADHGGGRSPRTITTASTSCWSAATAETSRRPKSSAKTKARRHRRRPVPVRPSRRRGDGRAAVTTSPSHAVTAASS